MSSRHFSDRHYEGSASGPFSFLNPTTRRIPLTSGQTNIRQQLSRDTSRNGESPVEKPAQDGAASKPEIRAEDVHHKWRTRDNRKGSFKT